MLIPNLITKEREYYGISKNVIPGKLKKLFSFWQGFRPNQRKVLSQKKRWEILLLLKGDL
jgi:hypothetical protein